MDKRFKEIIKKAKGVTLTKTEKIHGRARLLAMIRGVEAVALPAVRHSWTFRLARPIMAGFLITAILGGGVSFASENSLPGDLLYPIKVSVNEEVRAALAVNDESKADWEARRAERRFEEAVRLAAEERLDDKLEASVEEAIERHAKKAEERMAKAEAGNESEYDADVDFTYQSVMSPEAGAADNVEKDAGFQRMFEMKSVAPILKNSRENEKDGAREKRELVREKIARTRKAISELKELTKKKNEARVLERELDKDSDD